MEQGGEELSAWLSQRPVTRSRNGCLESSNRGQRTVSAPGLGKCALAGQPGMDMEVPSEC